MAYRLVGQIRERAKGCRSQTDPEGKHYFAACFLDAGYSQVSGGPSNEKAIGIAILPRK